MNPDVIIKKSDTPACINNTIMVNYMIRKLYSGSIVTNIQSEYNVDTGQSFIPEKGEGAMKKFLSLVVLGLALCLMWLPAAVAYDLNVYIQSYDDDVYPGDIWDCRVRVYNPC